MQADQKIHKDILKIFKRNKECSIATFNKHYVCNSVVSDYNDGLNLYFGTFDDSMKGKNIEINNICAITINSLQMHGIITKLDKNSFEYKMQIDSYLRKFPYYRDFFCHDNNYLYKINPLIFLIYNYRKGERYKEEFVIDYKYYDELKLFYDNKEGTK